MTSDIGYRARITQAFDDRTYKTTKIANKWFGYWSSNTGVQGVADTLDTLKNSCRANGIRKGEYEIWKIYIGTELPGHPDWFPPEKVT